MNERIEARDARAKIANEAILESFCIECFDETFIQAMQSLILDDVHLSEAEITRLNWRVIHAHSNDGNLDTETDALVDWWAAQGISPVYMTSLERLVNHDAGRVLVMKLEQADSVVLNQIALGMWMFGEIPELPAQRISDWRCDIWFSCPLRFIVLSEHGGNGTTTIAGTSDLIEAIKSGATHDLYTWQDGVVPSWNQGASR